MSWGHFVAHAGAGVTAHQRQTSEWGVFDEARRIERTFRFKNFAEAFAFVQQVADLPEAEGHHPDISFGWGYVTVSLQTKKIKGLHENDFIVAAKLNRIAETLDSVA
jgi:4a-hydroxytetrahydrobiopterin dehydratase